MLASPLVTFGVTVMVRHDGVVATIHVFHCCSCVMAICRVGTHATGVVVVEPEAMCPTIVHVNPIIGYDGLRSGILSWCNCGVHRLLALLDRHWLDDGGIGTVKSGLTSSQFVHMLLVLASEVKAKFKKFLIGNWVNGPHVTGCCENAGGFKEEKG